MNYATQQDVIDRVGVKELIAITDRADPPTYMVDAVSVDRSLADASAEIDSYLAARYVLPMTEIPVVLKRLAVEMAVYQLLSLRPMGDIEDTRRRYDDALAFLKQVASGKVSLGISANSLPATNTPNVSVIMQAKSRVFTRDTLKDF